MRDWLLYSPSAKQVYCYHCKLFGESESVLVRGFNDWKHFYRIAEHPESPEHLKSINCFLDYRESSARIDKNLEIATIREQKYWYKVLHRIIETVIFLAERNQPFRGHDEKLGSKHNGMYLGSLELISKFDPFLKEHLEKHAEKGKGSSSYVSKTICEEFIQLLAEKTLAEIIAEIKMSGYYSVSVDSTPDISHVDQLTVIFRYVKPCGKVVERFVTFIDIDSHKGADLADYLLNFLKLHDIDITLCRGQSYDNASNMSGKYNGMQAKIKEINPYAAFIPCAAHSLNLVGHTAIDPCPVVANFFALVQKLYTFFSASTHRWKILTDILSIHKCPVPKSRSETRWSADARSVNSLALGYTHIIEALNIIANDTEEKNQTRLDASSISKKLNKLETSILCEIWNHILHSFNVTSKALQKAGLELGAAAALYQGLKEELTRMRDNFSLYETNGKEKIENSEFSTDKRRTVSGWVQGVQFQPSDDFRIRIFLVIIDKLVSELELRAKCYTKLAAKFDILINNALDNLNDEDIRNGIREIMSSYPEDFSGDFYAEFHRFKGFILPMQHRKSYSESNAEFYMKTIYNHNLADVFPNITVWLKIFLSLMLMNCTGERSFSVLKLIKNYLRSTMTQPRLASLALLSIESDMLRSLDHEAIINDFSVKKSRKVFVSV